MSFQAAAVELSVLAVITTAGNRSNEEGLNKSDQ